MPTSIPSSKRKTIDKKDILDRFIEWGFDGIITMEPTAGMELGRVREQVGHKLV